MILWSPKSTKTYVPFPSLKTKKKNHIFYAILKKITQVAKFSQEKEKEKEKKN